MGRGVRDPAARERIVDVAAAVVAKQGVPGATVRGIAAEAGVSTGFITHYFEGKQELMVEVLRRTNARAARRVRRAASKGSGLAGLRAAVEAVLPLDAGRRREWQVWVAMWAHASPDDALGAGYREGWKGLRAIFAELLERARAEGDLRRGIDVPYEAERLVTMVAGIGLLAGVETAARVRSAATRMLSEQLTLLGGVSDRKRSAA
jgi:AcrR family transcriptional regulator